MVARETHSSPRQGVLYLVATPIGNLEDFSLRGKRILSEVDVVAAEDTRRTSWLLRRFGIRAKKLFSFYQENERRRLSQLTDALLSGKKVALVSNAGTPLISDPGYKLVRKAIAAGAKVVVIPGPSAVIAALIVSGFSPARFLFLGFLPKKKGERRKLLRRLGKLDPRLTKTVVFYESPNRLKKTLEIVQEVLGNISVAICRELTKKHEEVLRGTVQEILLELEKEKVKGEVTVVVSLSNETH